MNNIEYLKAARAVIEKPENFTTGDWARDAEGTSVDVTDPKATCYCTLGAMRKVSYLTGANMTVKAEAELHLYKYADAYGKTVASFNDTQGQI